MNEKKNQGKPKLSKTDSSSAVPITERVNEKTATFEVNTVGDLLKFAKQKRRALEGQSVTSPFVTGSLQSITKKGIEYKIAESTASPARLDGEANYVSAIARLADVSMRTSMMKFPIPSTMTEDHPIGDAFSLIKRYYPNYEQVSEYLNTVVGQLADSYYISSELRQNLISVAMERVETILSPDVQLPPSTSRETVISNVKSKLETILIEGLTRNLRDTFGRTVPIDSQIDIERLVTRSCTVVANALTAAERFIDISNSSMLIDNLAELERRADDSIGEYARMTLMRLATDLADSAINNPVVALFVKNRLEFSFVSTSEKIDVTLLQIGEALRSPVASIKPRFGIGSTFVADVDFPSIRTMFNATELESVTVIPIIKYIQKALGITSSSSTIDEVLRSAGVPQATDLASYISMPREEFESTQMSTVQKLHEYFFEQTILKLLASSFVSAPSYNLKILSKLRTSDPSIRNVDNIEPVLIAVDHLRTAYLSSIRQMFDFFMAGVYLPSADEYARLESIRSDSLMMTRDFGTPVLDLFIGFVDKSMAKVSQTNQKMVPQLAVTSWSSHSYNYSGVQSLIVSKPPHIVAIQSYLDKDLSPSFLTESESNQLNVALLTGAVGTFSTNCYMKLKYKYSDDIINRLASLVPASVYTSLCEQMRNAGLPNPEALNIVRLTGEELSLYLKLWNKGADFKSDQVEVMTLVEIPREIYLMPHVAEDGVTIMRNKASKFSPFLTIFKAPLSIVSSGHPVKANRIGAEAVGLFMRPWPVSASKAEVIGSETTTKMFSSLTDRIDVGEDGTMQKPFSLLDPGVDYTLESPVSTTE